MGQAKKRGSQEQRAAQAMARELAAVRPSLDALEDDAPVTVGMLRDCLDEVGQAVGFVLSGALLEAGLSGSKSRSIALALQTLMAQGAFRGAAGDAVAGIVYGITMHLEAKPGEIGLR